MQKEEEMRKRKLCMCYELPPRIVFVINFLVFFFREAAESYESPHGGNNLEKSDAEKALYVL